MMDKQIYGKEQSSELTNEELLEIIKANQIYQILNQQVV